MAFVRAAELGSFAAAANALNVTPAAIGQTVKRLEDRFGVKLMSRTTRKMSLTPEGWLLLSRCRRPLAELDEVAEVFNEARGVVSGELRVSAPLEFGRNHLLPVIAAFRAKHPTVAVELDVSDRIRDFVDDPIDVAFRLHRPEDGTLIARPISALQAVTVASPAYIEQHGAPRHPQDLERHTCINYRYPSSGALYAWSFLIDGQEMTVLPKGGIVVNDPEVSCEAAALGLGVLQTGSNYAAPYLKGGRLRLVMARFMLTTRTLYLCYPSREHMPLRVRAFIDFALQQLGRDRLLISARSVKAYSKH